MKALFLSAFVLLTACESIPAQTVGDAAFAKKLSGLLDSDVPAIDVAHVTDQAIYLDAREQAEFNVSHIKDARAVGYNEFDLQLLSDLPKDTAIIVYCSVGYRSQKVTEKLIEAGFTNVQNLYGGIFEWVNSGHPVVDQQGPTKRVHTYNKDWSKWLTKGVMIY